MDRNAVLVDNLDMLEDSMEEVPGLEEAWVLRLEEVLDIPRLVE